jgi:hypothetical protein
MTEAPVMDLFFIWAEPSRRHSDRKRRVAAENAFYESYAGDTLIKKRSWWGRMKARFNAVSGMARADLANGEEQQSARDDCQATVCKATIA